MKRAALLTVIVACAAAPAAQAAKPAYDDFKLCGPASDARPTLVVGTVGCQRIGSRAVGTTTAFSYYVPPACAPARRRPCPVVYIVHGGGGDIWDIGTPDKLGGLALALTSGPPHDPTTVAEPWKLGDPRDWVSKPAINAILVGLLSRTLPHGYGPFAGADGGWFDWNPRYARGGDQQAYDTPPPRFETMAVDEVMPYVERWFPVIGGRQATGLIGCSLGGYGTMHLGLRHPDRFASIVSSSMVGDPRLVSEGYATRPTADGAGAVPGYSPYTVLPGVVPGGAGPFAEPLTRTGAPFSSYLGTAAYGLGDVVADRGYFEGHAPAQLATNAYAHAGDVQSIYIHRTVFDAIPHDPNDNDPGSIVAEQLAGAEVAALTRAMRGAGIEEGVETWPGLHCRIGPYLRRTLELVTTHVRHQDGGGAPAPAPTRFDYRSIDRDFSTWGWHVSVDRVPTEFLSLWDVTCGSLTLQGTGTATVTAPRSCHTGRGGSRTFTAALGPTPPTDDLGAQSVYAVTRTVRLSPLPPCTDPGRVVLSLRAPRGFRARRALLRVGGRTRRVGVKRVGNRLRATVDLTGRTGTVRVKLVITGGGRRIATTRIYKLCE
jgi:hypothetical protein